MTHTRRLYLLRHAQAAPARPGQPDHDRVLDAQGEADARALGLRLERRDFTPALILCSTAARTRGTLECLGRAIGEAEIRFDRRIYDDGEDGCRAALAEADDSGDVLLIGHNPSIANFARRMAATGSPPALEALVRGFPTATLACLRQGPTPGWDGWHLDDVLSPPHQRD